MEFNYANIPLELKRLKHWVCWGDARLDFENMSKEERRKQKLPKNPHTGGNAMTNNSETWGTFLEAYSALQKYKFKGLGFMLGEGYFGVDLDNCDNELKMEFVDTLQSYSEYSMSGNGIHIICKGTLPEGQRRKGNIEMYEKERYFIMTGNKINNNPIVDCTDKIKPLHTKYLYTPIKVTTPTILDYEVNTEIDMLDIGLEKDPKLAELWYSTPSGSGGNESETDLALIAKIAYWCNNDFNAIKNRFLESPYYSRKDNYHRAKIDNRDDYLTNTINKAIYSSYSTAIVDNTKFKQELQNKQNLGEIKRIMETTETYDEETGEIKKVYENNDTGNAKRLVDKYGHLIRYNTDNNCWYIYDGKRWKVDDTLEIKRLADLIIEDVKSDFINVNDKSEMKELAKNYDRLTSSKGKECMIKESQHLQGIPVLNADFDRDNMMLNVNNGVVDLRDGKIYDHNSDMNLSKIVRINYDPNATCPRWLQFLEEIFLGDKELIEWVQKSVGYSLTGSTKEQCMFFCYGEGSNGKSVFLDTIKNVVGSYGLNTQPETVMTKKKDVTELGADVARLKGARFVSTVETNQGARLNESLIKQMTGEDDLVARFLYGKPFEFKPEFKIWMATNHRPVIIGTDNGIWRRVKLIPFKATFSGSQIDKDLKNKLTRELSGILNWAVEGCIKWQKEEYTTPSSVEMSTKEYRKEMDVLEKFIEEVIEIKEPFHNYRTKASDLFRAYKGWAKENNQYKDMNNTVFGREMSKKFEKIKANSGTVYKDITIREEFSRYLNNYVI